MNQKPPLTLCESCGVPASVELPFEITDEESMEFRLAPGRRVIRLCSECLLITTHVILGNVSRRSKVLREKLEADPVVGPLLKAAVQMADDIGTEVDLWSFEDAYRLLHAEVKK